jgi:hypothetical protein
LENSQSSNYNLFLLGAGFTKSVFPNAPLNKDLLPLLCEGIACATLKRYYKEQKTNDIEILLTHLDLEILRPKRREQIALQQVRKAIEQQLAKYFGQFRFGLRKKDVLGTEENSWLEPFSKELFNEHDAIISLNYDCFLEGLLDHYEVWSPNGYAAIDTFFSKDLPENSKNILIYKIHGSENFVIAGAIDNTEKKGLSFEVNSSIYPQSGKNRSYSYGGRDACPYIIAPSFVKIPHEDIERMMNEVLTKAALAKNLIIIGCGLRPEDSYLWFLITNFMSQNDPDRRSTEDKSIIIVDPKAKEIEERINSRYFGGIEGFSVKITLFSNGLAFDCDQLIKHLNNLRKPQNK